MASQNAYIKLLIAWGYYPAVGYLVEALKVAANYYSANPKHELSLKQKWSFVSTVLKLDFNLKNSYRIFS